MQPLAVIEAPLSLDLSPLTRHLWAERVVHRVVENGDKQVLLLADPADVERIRELLEDWKNGTLSEPVEQLPEPGTGLLARLLSTPLTLALVVLLTLVFGWQHVSSDWVAWLQNGDALWPEARNQFSTYIELGLWGLWRHTILHLSVLHLVFNLTMLLALGRAMERLGERGAILTLLFACGLTGSLLQWWLSGPGFAGVSGVVYGMAAWTGLRQARYGVPYGIPKALLGVIVFFMLLSITGDTLLPGQSVTANGGHLGGLLCGFLLALLWPVPTSSEPEGNNEPR